MRFSLRDQLHRLPTLMRYAPGLMLAGPLLSLGSYWVGGETGLLLGVSLMVTGGLAAALISRRDPPFHSEAEFLSAQSFLTQLEDNLTKTQDDSLGTACIVLQLDDASLQSERYGRSVVQEAMARLGDRLVISLRRGDRIMALESGGFAIAILPTRRLNGESLIHIASRLQNIIEAPVLIGGARLFLSCSAGFCLNGRASHPGGAGLLEAAQTAAEEALRDGPSALRIYAPGMIRKRADRDARRLQLEEALDQGQIKAWFQPQISADTGDITGFEALARWHHPERGLINPAEFLDDIGSLGLSERLSEVMTFNALTALARWDAAGLHVPKVAVNFSGDELRNPRLADKLKWELDRFDLTPERLVIEVLETVMTSSDSDIIVRNIAALAQFGCPIDLDDFGTGHSSMTNVRRLAVHRLKIDRSFATRVDQDVDQQRMVAAIFSLAERLGLDTLAEGVETQAELSLLSQLGCGHVQGFGIARPMPFDDTLEWIRQHHARPSLSWTVSDSPS